MTHETLPVVAAALLTTVLAGCGTVGSLLGGSTSTPAAASAAGPAASAAAAAPADPAAERAEVRQIFENYNRALLARDFDTVCGFMAPEAVSAVQLGAGQQGMAASTCEEAFGSVYANRQAATVLDETARGTRVTDVTVDGDRATVTFTAQVQGTNTGELTGDMRRVDGEWRILPNR